MWWMSSIAGLLLTVGVIGLSSTGAAELTFTVQRPEQVQTFASSGEAQLARLAPTPEMNIRAHKLTGRIKRHVHPQSHHFLYLIQGQKMVALRMHVTFDASGQLIAPDIHFRRLRQ